MKAQCLLWLLIGISTLSAQEYEFTAGPSVNFFYDFQGNDPHTRTNYTPGLGYRLQVGIGKMEIEGFQLPFRLSFAYENYAGNISIGRGGLGGSSGINVDLRKSVVAVGVYPFNPRIGDQLCLSFGIEGVALIKEDFQGTSNNWLLYGPSTSTNINSKYDKLSPPFQMGFRANCSYEIALKNGITLSPQYSLYLGLGRETLVYADVVHTMRHFFGLGVKKYWPYEKP